MPNPDYLVGLTQIGKAVAAGNTAQRLIFEANTYIFVEEVSESDRQLFEYVASLDGIPGDDEDKYVAPQPGEATETYPVPGDPTYVQLLKSYVGIYVDRLGEFSGEYPEGSNTFPGILKIDGVAISEDFEGLPRDRAQAIPELSVPTIPEPVVEDDC